MQFWSIVCFYFLMRILSIRRVEQENVSESISHRARILSQTLDQSASPGLSGSKTTQIAPGAQTGPHLWRKKGKESGERLYCVSSTLYLTLSGKSGKSPLRVLLRSVQIVIWIGFCSVTETRATTGKCPRTRWPGRSASVPAPLAPSSRASGMATWPSRFWKWQNRRRSSCRPSGMKCRSYGEYSSIRFIPQHC